MCTSAYIRLCITQEQCLSSFFYPGRGTHISKCVLWPRLMLPLNFVVRSESWRCKGAAWEAAEKKENKTWIQVFLPSTMLDRWSYLALKDSNLYWYSGNSPPLCLAEVEKKFRNRTLQKHIPNISQFVWQESEGPFRFVFSERDIMAPFHFICLD